VITDPGEELALVGAAARARWVIGRPKGIAIKNCGDNHRTDDGCGRRF